MPPVTVVIADANKTTRAQSMNILQAENEISVVGVARNGLEAILTADALKPHILIFNLNLIKGRGDNLLRTLRRKSPNTRMILLTRRGFKGPMLEVLSQGALGYLNEKAINTHLSKAVRQVEAGEAWVPRRMATRIVDRLSRQTIAEAEEASRRPPIGSQTT